VALGIKRYSIIINEVHAINVFRWRTKLFGKRDTCKEFPLSKYKENFVNFEVKMLLHYNWTELSF
jgi:hypothetical protein